MHGLVRAIGLALIAALGVVLFFRTPATGSAPLAVQSPSPTPSASGSSSPTPSASPTASGSPSPTVSPSPTGSPGFDPNYRRVRLSVSHRNVRVGRRVIFSGTIEANRPECSVDAAVSLQRLIAGTSRRLTVDTATTDVNGRFRMEDDVRWSSTYYAVAHRGRDCLRRESGPEAVRAHVRFNVKVSDPTPPRYSNTRIFGRVRPSHPNSEVALQQKRGGRWRTIQRTDVSAQSKFSFFPYASWPGTRAFRIKWPKSDRDHETGLSRVVKIRTHS